MTNHNVLLSLLLFISLLDNTVVGCQSCLAAVGKNAIFGFKKKDALHVDGDDSSMHIIHNNALPLGILKSHPIRSRIGFDTSIVLGFLALRSYAVERVINRNHDTTMIPISTPKQQIKRKWAGGFFIEEELESKDSAIEEDGKDIESLDSTESNEVEDITSASMIMAIGFYKNWISPLLPPACRFLPTCSQYGVQAIEKYGPQKGLILTAWRLARCTPLGGKGYDPPKWPVSKVVEQSEQFQIFISFSLLQIFTTARFIYIW